MPTPQLIPPFEALAVPAAPANQREIVFGEGWQFDFDKGEFVITPTGQVARTTGVDTLMQWIRKTLITQRFSYPIYPTWYGSDLPRLIGVRAAREAIATEVIRLIRDALMVDARIKDIQTKGAKIQDDQVYVDFTVVAFNGQILELTQAVEV